MLLYALYITKKIMTKTFSFKVGKSGGKAFISRLAYSVLVIITTKKHIIDKKKIFTSYIANLSHWKSFLVFADQSVISSEIASAIGFGYTKFQQTIQFIQRKFSISIHLQCKLSNSYTEIQNLILIALNYAFFNDKSHLT